VTVEIYEGAGHGFTWPSAPNYHEAAATGAWKATTTLFAAAFA
jgi:carboxymethylenebutenolidase